MVNPQVDERFDAALRALTLADGDVHERLAQAWRELSTLTATDLPAPLQEDFRALEHRWSSAPARPGADRFDAVAESLSEDEAGMAVQHILRMDARLKSL